MTIAVVGPGGLGCLLASDLLRFQAERIVLVDYNQDRIRHLSAQGLNREDMDGKTVHLSVNLADTVPGDARVVFLAVKATALETLLPLLAPRLHPEAVVISLQNGWPHQEILGRFLPADRLVFAVTSMGAISLGCGRVRHTGLGTTRTGSHGGAQGRERSLQVAALLSRVGWPAEDAADIREWLWRKLVVNCGINALGALLDVTNGQLLELPAARSLQRILVAEAVAVGQGLGFDLDRSSCLTQVEEVCRLTTRNMNSMLQDLKKPAPTEIGFINGAVVSEGERLGIPCPCNNFVARLIMAHEQKI